jgi:hypothetical protein
MTISKKVALLITFALGIQLTAGAFFNEPQTQKSIILTFAQNLRNHNTSKEALTVAQWLDTQCINGSGSGYYRNDILEIIQNNDLSEKTKLTLFSSMISQQKRDNIKSFVFDVCGGIVCIGMFGTLAWLIAEDAKRPRTPGITVTYRTKRYDWPFLSDWPLTQTNTYIF